MEKSKKVIMTAGALKQLIRRTSELIDNKINEVPIIVDFDSSSVTSVISKRKNTGKD